MEKLVELKSVNAGYNNQLVLEDINFVINSDDFIGIIGPNGGGKTTLLKVILGQLKPFSGSVQYHPDLIKNDGATGYLPQTAEVDRRFPITVKDVLLSGLVTGKRIIKRFSRKDMETADRLLDQMNIRNLEKKNIGDLSGGQMQRVLLGRAIISNPRLLILDEPSTYVDNRFEHDLYNTLTMLNKKMAIIMVSHDIGTIAAYIKSIACVNRTLHYHASNIISQEQLAAYDCPVQLIAHGDVPHTVLHKHED